MRPPAWLASRTAARRRFRRAGPVRAAFDPDLPERRLLAGVERPERRPTEMREDQAPDTLASGRHGDRAHRGVAADPAGEPDGAVPAGRVHERERCAGRPGRKPQKLGRPDDPVPPGGDQVAARRMRRVDHPPRDDVKLAPAVGGDPGLEPPRGGEAPDRSDQLCPRVGHEPRIQSPFGLRARAPVQHDPATAVLDQQTRRGVTGRGHGPDAKQRDSHGGRRRARSLPAGLAGAPRGSVAGQRRPELSQRLGL